MTAESDDILDSVFHNAASPIMPSKTLAIWSFGSFSGLRIRPSRKRRGIMPPPRPAHPAYPPPARTPSWRLHRPAEQSRSPPHC
jgi:hypothetical protein